MPKIVLFVGGYNGPNDALAQSLLAPGLRLLRVDSRELAEAILGCLRIAAVVFAFDIGTSDILGVAEEVRRRGPSSPQILAVTAGSESRAAAMSAAAVMCVERWAESSVVRDRLLESLDLPRVDRRWK